MTVVCRGGESYEELEAMADMVATTRGKLAVYDDMMYYKKASLVHSPCRLMLICSKPCL